MLLNKTRLITERQNRAWSQSELAQAADLSLRTIQRIEKEGRASLESAKALASVYCLDITDIYQKEAELDKTIATPSKVKIPLVLLTAQAKTIVLTLFILSSVIMLFLVWTNLPNVNWIHQIRDTWFSAELSFITLNTISLVIALLASFVATFTLGLLLDAVQGKGFYGYVKARFLSGEFSVERAINAVKLYLLAWRKLLAKPVLISTAVIFVFAIGIFLTMEDYQKERMTSFIEILFSPDSGIS